VPVLTEAVPKVTQLQECTDSDAGLREAAGALGYGFSYCSEATDSCNEWAIGSVVRSFCCATCSQDSGPAPTEWSDPNLTEASHVCVSNNGGFMLGFELWDTSTNHRMPMTDTYAAGGRECRDISDIPSVDDAHPILIVVYLTAGQTITLGPVIYNPGLDAMAGSANLTCLGGTGTPRCVTYLTDGSEAQVQQFPRPDLAIWQPVVRASQICLTNNGGYRLRFQLWNTAWSSLSPVSDSFDHSSSRCISGDFISEVHEDNPLVPIAYVEAGGSKMFHSVIYDEGAAAASYVCDGTAWLFSCRLTGT
jgi:hypothetical protein